MNNDFKMVGKINNNFLSYVIPLNYVGNQFLINVGVNRGDILTIGDKTANIIDVYRKLNTQLIKITVDRNLLHESEEF